MRFSIIDGSDYTGLVRQFTFDSVDRNTDISVSVIGNDIFELTELFVASLAFPGDPPRIVVLTPDSAQVTILDDDGQYQKFNMHASITCNNICMFSAFLKCIESL